MASDFESAVKEGLMLTKRLYYGKEPPKLQTMTTSCHGEESFLPTAAMAYAVVSDPEIVDNPDVPSYQPYVHGKCDPAALMPLQMTGPVAMEVECLLDHATVSMTSAWRVHCIKAGRKCSCLFALPLGNQGSLLGAEIRYSGRQCRSQIVALEGDEQKRVNGRYLNGNIYTFVIPKVDAGSIISAKFSWSQQLRCSEGEFSLRVHFKFPPYVNRIHKNVSYEEKILLHIISGTHRSILQRDSSHALEEINRDAGKVGFLYKSSVSLWSTIDFTFSFSIPSTETYGVALKHVQKLRGGEDDNMLCLYLCPGSNQSRKVLKRDAVFVIDISKSMEGPLLDAVKIATSSFLTNLTPQDTFNIVAFNDAVHLFSPAMETASELGVQKATRWLNHKISADGGTNILLALQQALKLVPNNADSMPFIFLITDGTVDDERIICNLVRESLADRTSITPRISTFGIGTFYNQYFLRMLAQIGRGHFRSADDEATIAFELQRLFEDASAPVLLDLSIEAMNDQDEFEFLLPTIPDLSSQCPLVLPGRYTGSPPETIRLTGVSSDMSDHILDVKVRNANDFPQERAMQLLARRCIEAETIKAWFMQSKDMENRVAELSIDLGIPSEYSQMVLLVAEDNKQTDLRTIPKMGKVGSLMKKVDGGDCKEVVLGRTGVGFGNVKSTVKNTRPGMADAKSPDASERVVAAASNCCNETLGRCWCCVWLIGVCSRTSKQSTVVLSQICAALACFQIVQCCYEICSPS